MNAGLNVAVQQTMQQGLLQGDDAGPARAGGGWWASLGGWGFVVFLLAYSALLLSWFAPAICMPDDNGYFAQASLLVRTGSSWFVPESDAQYIGMHWLLTPDGKYVSRYPGGLSVFIAAIYATLGWKAAVLTNPLLGLAALVGTFLLARRLTGSAGWGVAAAAVLGLNPTFIHHTLGGDAHTAVACMVAWAGYLLLRWHEERKLWLAAFAGACLGMIPVIRYPDGIMYVGFGAMVFTSLALWASAGGGKRPWLHLAVMAAVAILVMSPQLYRNQTVLGAFWRTGYTLSNEDRGFGWQYFQNNFFLYIRTLSSGGMGPFVALGLAGIAGLAASRTTRLAGIMLAGIFLPMLLVYMSYYWAGAGGGGGGGGAGNGAGIMRFLLPTFVVLSVAGVWAMSRVAAGLGGAGTAAAIGLAVVGFQAIWGVPQAGEQQRRLEVQRQNLARVTTELERVAEPGAVVLTDQGLAQHIDFVRNWKLADPMVANGGGMPMRRRAQNDDDPSPMQAAKQRARSELYTGTFDERQRQFEADLVKWADGKRVYLVLPENQLRQYERRGQVKIVSRVSLARAPEGTMGGPGGGGPGGGPGGGGPGGGPGGGGPGMGPGGPQDRNQGGPGGFGPQNDRPQPGNDPGPNGRAGPGAGGPPGTGQPGGGGFFGGGPGGGPGGGAGGPGPGGLFGGRGQRGGPGGGGMMSAGTFNNASEVLIAEWTPRGK